MVGSIVFFFPKKNTQEVKTVKKKQTPEISFYHQEYKERYDTYQKAHQDLSKKEVITLVNMNRDFDFYGKIIKQEHPNDLNTIVNKYYQLDETYEPSDLVEINTNAGTYGSSYSKHTARKVIYDDFQALKQACINKGFELYVTSGYRSTAWQKEIYNHMVETYSVERADETCSRPGHSEHTTGLGLDIALDQYKYEEVENHPQYPFYWHEWETVIKYCDQQMHLQGKPIDLEQLKSDTVIAHQMFEKIVQDYLNHGDSVISNKLNNEHRPENQRPQQKTKWQSPETKIIHPAEPSMQERFNRAWKKVNDEEAAAGETDEGALEGAVKCMMEK